MMRASVASAKAVTSSPPITRLSLLASARSIPSVRVTIDGPRPAAPTTAFSTRSGLELVISSRTPASPASTRPFHSLSAGSAARSSASATAGTPWRFACSSRDSQLESAESPATCRSALEAITSSAWSPIDRVEPSMSTRRTAAQCRDGPQAELTVILLGLEPAVDEAEPVVGARVPRLARLVVVDAGDGPTGAARVLIALVGRPERVLYHAAGGSDRHRVELALGDRMAVAGLADQQADHRRAAAQEEQEDHARGHDRGDHPAVALAVGLAAAGAGALERVRLCSAMAADLGGRRDGLALG